jgi:hypothetical protein
MTYAAKKRLHEFEALPPQERAGIFTRLLRRTALTLTICGRMMI